MTAQKVYDLLSLIEEKNGLYEEETERLLSFIYNDVYGKYDQKISDCDTWQYRESLENHKGSLGSFLDEDDDSILFYYYEMINDNKTEFIEKFFSVCNKYFKIIDNNFYNTDDFNPIVFTFNIYTFLKLYHESKDNFDYFSTMVDSFSFLILDNKLFDHSYGNSWDLFLEDKKDVLSLLISLNAFEKMPVLKEFGVSFLEKVADGVNDESDLFSRYTEVLENLRVYIPIIEGLKDHPLYKEENVTRFIEEVLESCNLDLKVIFSPNYFLGDRHEVVKFKLDDSVEHSDFSNSLYERISDLSIPIFDYLNEEGCDKDSFVECLDIVFDSDTYYELDSKLKSLSEACNLFDSGEKEESLKLIRGLTDEKHKKVILDKSISYRSDLVNKADKPELISDREKECIEGVFGTFDGVIYAEVDDVFESSSDIDEFEEGITSLVEKHVNEQSNTPVVKNVTAYNFDEVVVPQKRIGFFKRRN